MNALIDNLRDVISQSKDDPKFYLIVVGGVLTASIVTAGAYVTYLRLGVSFAFRKKKVYPKDVVVVHGAGRGPFCPSLSPCCVKVETYLRMNRIPHMNENKDIILSKNGKIPWIEYNGEIVEDSSFILQYFNKKMNIDLNKGLSDAEKAIARSLQKLTEESLLWSVALCRWVYDYTDNAWTGAGWLFPKLLKRTVRQNAWAAGMGRHTQSEVLHIMEDDIKALSDYLGKKQFFMGNDPTEVDAALFGMLSMLVWQSPKQPCIGWLKEKYPNLQAYCYRMKGLFWKDWDDCITHSRTRQATR